MMRLDLAGLLLALICTLGLLNGCERDKPEIVPPKAAQAPTRPALPAGPIVLRPGAPANARLAISGWAAPQGDHRWTNAKSAKLRLPSEAITARRVSLRAKTLVAMDVDLLLNDVYFGTFRSDGRRVLTQEFPLVASMFKAGENVLELRVPQLVSPATGNPKAKDKRELGVMVLEITLLP